MTTRNVRKVAEKVLERTKDWSPKGTICWYEASLGRGERHFIMFDLMTVAELKSLAASCLTQAPDREKK